MAEASAAMDAPEETKEQRDERMAIIEQFAVILKETRTAAIEWRRGSGIEQIWDEDDSHYLGEDEYNRGGQWTKGRNTTDAITQSTKKAAKNRSTVFLNITRPYVDAAAARVADMLLPTDDRNWAIKPTPLPQMLEAMKDQRPVTDVVPPQRKAKFSAFMGKLFGGQQQPEQPQAPVPTVAEVASQAKDRATAAADAAQKQIDDWHVECGYHAEVRKMIEATARIGTGILKGPVPKNCKSRAVVETPDGFRVKIETKVSPESREISARRLYPDPACGDNIHDGNFVWEEDDLTARKLLELKGLPGYIPEMIDQVIEEGPCNPIDGKRRLPEGKRTELKDLFQVWYYHGQVSRKDMEAAGCSCAEGVDYYPCIVTMVNDRVIRVRLNPLDSGRFPYDVMVWQANGEHWAGVGVARQMRTCQKGVNAALRNLMDNAGLASGPMVIIDRSKLQPAIGPFEIAPRKFYYTKENVEGVNVRDAFTIIKIDMLMDELLALVQFWSQKAEEVTGLPMLMQGQQGSSNPTDTLGIAQIQNNNGSTVLRRIARTFDDRITEPHIGGYYEYLLVDANVPNEAKGEFTIDARGSSALLERDMQNQQMPTLAQLALNPAYELSPARTMQELLKSLRFDTKRFELTDDEKKAMAEREQPKPPQVLAAEIREQGAAARQDKELQARATQGDAERQLKMILADMDDELGKMELSEEARQAVDNHKVKLATLQMELRQQAALSPGPQVREPPTEPAGKAPRGMAFPL
jgi:hypothetical protein